MMLYPGASAARAHGDDHRGAGVSRRGSNESPAPETEWASVADLIGANLTLTRRSIHKRSLSWYLDYETAPLRVFLTQMSVPQADPALAAVLRRVREEREETQEDVAFEAGVTVITVRRAESGTVMPSWGTVRAVARALEINLAELGTAVEREEG
jgi:DNA-binding XRE family transcriptional regulator